MVQPAGEHIATVLKGSFQPLLVGVFLTKCSIFGQISGHSGYKQSEYDIDN